MFTFIFLAIFSGVVCHLLFTASFLRAALYAAIATGAAYQIVNYNLLGYLDPLFIVVFTTSVALGFIVALVVGIPFFLARRARKRRWLKAGGLC